MAVKGFNHYNIRAQRVLLDQLRDFYCDVVGLSVGERPTLRSFGYWLYIGEKDVLHLSEASADEVRATDVLTTFDHVAFTCSNQPEMEAHLAQKGITFNTRVVATTGVRQIFFRDPAGNGVEFNFLPSE
ncbi:MAG TPA: VOC family protein [Methylophilaceae bacterium]|nr:VOC family protein [Methylophilaceae bacterium]